MIPLATLISMALGIAVITSLKVNLAPALAVGIIPMILDHADIEYVGGVLLGTSALALSLMMGW
jgi:hypothetical protein